MIKSIATVAVYVDNQEKALDFWVNKVGFVKKAQIDMGNGYFWLEVAPKDAQSAIVLYPKELMPIWNELKASITFECSNIAAFHSSLKQKGVEISREPEERQGGSFMSFKDPEEIEFLLKESK